MKFSTPQTPEQGEQIRALLNRVFHPQRVGDLARTFFHHLPGLKKEHWFTLTQETTGEPVSSFTLIPWTWEMEGIRLEVAEMGLVGTLDTCRGQGMMTRLNHHFDTHVKAAGVDLCIIQGIPGFYHNFGYHYALEFESHLDLPLALIPAPVANNVAEFEFRRANLDDIDFLMAQDAHYRNAHTFSVFRSRDEWAYLLTHSKSTEYGSDFWIMGTEAKGPKFYARIPFEGFGNGLILSEISQDISHGGFAALMVFCKSLATDGGKPHIRINLHSKSPGGRMALAMGAAASRPYAWQIKIPDRIGFLNRITPVLEKRLEKGIFKNYTGQLRLDLYTESIDLVFDQGRITIARGDRTARETVFCIPGDLFTPLILGYRSWKDLQYCRPDIFPANQYLRFKPAVLPDEAGVLVDTLFPPGTSWIYERY